MTRKTKYEIVIAVLLIAVILVIAMFNTKETVYVEENGQKVPSLTIEDLQKTGTRVSVLAASELCDAANDCFPKAEALQYDNFTDEFNAVSTGKADAALAYTSFLTIVPESQPELTNIRENIEEYEYGFALPKNDAGDKLLKEMNAYLGEMIDSGELDALQKKWAQSDGKDVMGDYEFSGENGVLNICTGGTFVTKTFYVGEKLTGEFIEIANGFCQAYGYTPKYTTLSYAAQITGLKSGDYDLMVDTVVRLPDRLDSVNITAPVFRDQVYVFVPAKTQTIRASGPAAFWRSLKKSFEKNLIHEDRWRLLASGLGTTLGLALLAGIFGTVLAAFLCALRMRKNDWAAAVTDLYCRVFRGIPVVVLLLVLNYLVFKGADFSAFWVCVIGFSLDFAAYASEIFRSGIEAVPRGQWRAARALGFSSVRGFRKVIFPQALVHILPAYTGQLVGMVKLTSIAGYISVMDLTRASDIIRSRTYEAFFPLVITAVIYFLLCVLIIEILRVIERRIQPGTRSNDHLQSLVGSWQDMSMPLRDSCLQNQASAQEILFTASHLRKSYEEVTPITDVSFQIRSGEVISVIGPSGTGKSTLLNMLNQLDPNDDGTILFKGVDVKSPGFDLNELRQHVGMVFQSFNLFPHLTIVENVMLAQTELLKRSEEEALSRSMQMLERVGLNDKALNYPGELSGGQQQRVAIARAVAMDPEVILLDEPTSALDPNTTREVLAVVRDLAMEGMTMLIVTHEMWFAREVASRVFYMDQGEIYEDGTPEQIFDAPRRDRTRLFIQQLQVLTISIGGSVFDYGSASEQIDTFGLRHLLDAVMIRSMIIFTEELGVSILQKHYGEEADITFRFEYNDRDGSLHIRTEFRADDDFDPLAEGDKMAVALIRSRVSDLRFECQDGYGVVECEVK